MAKIEEQETITLGLINEHRKEGCWPLSHVPSLQWINDVSADILKWQHVLDISSDITDGTRQQQGDMSLQVDPESKMSFLLFKPISLYNFH